jgi:hypothetical protein
MLRLALAVTPAEQRRRGLMNDAQQTLMEREVFMRL